jgi:DNA (cytosine-5)-methyltransferase 1
VTAYYNENDKYCTAWLRNLIAAGHIADGDLDERSIIDVRPSDLRGYTQAHFFAGIGGWSHALRLAGWPDDRLVWTGSCPCQPFSSAGAGKAADDERHLWPAWFSLIRECRPATIFGEQVEAAIGWGWLDAVFADLEAEGYACGAAVLPACAVGAPHIRQRLWFVADAGGQRAGRDTGNGAGAQGESESKRRSDWIDAGNTSVARGAVGLMADADTTGRGLERGGWLLDGERPPQRDDADGRGELHELGDPAQQLSNGGGNARTGWGRELTNASPWRDCDWLPCTDGKARPVESGTFPLAHGVSGRVGKLRAYGNAIVPQVASTFIGAYLNGEINAPNG